jgi:hypothetical protein
MARAYARLVNVSTAPDGSVEAMLDVAITGKEATTERTTVSLGGADSEATINAAVVATAKRTDPTITEIAHQPFVVA